MISLIFDTETTGIPLHPTARDDVQPRMIEWGGMLVNSDGEILEKWETLINPGVVIPDGTKRGKLLDAAGINKLTGINVDELWIQPGFREAAATIACFFHDADRVIAHNLPFDLTMMEMEIDRAGIAAWPMPKDQVCTVQEHIPEFGYRVREKDLYEYYTGQPLAQTHRALDDVHALLEICKRSGVLK